MLTYTKLRNTFATTVNNPSDTATLAIADDYINEQTRILCTERPWWFLEKAFTALTTTSQFISLPGQIDRIISSPYVTVSSIRYTPRQSPSREHWDRLNLITRTGDIPEWWYTYAGQLGLYPTPSTAGNTITFNAKQKVVDLTTADYTTGTITTIAAAGTAVTGSGTTWGAGMVGRYIRITGTNAANGGDDTWYPISAVASTTALTLGNPYGGTAIAAGSATYTIGQSSIIPEAYQNIPLWRALEFYFTSPIAPDIEKANKYGQLAKDLHDQMVRDHSNRNGGRVLDEGVAEASIINPNLTVGF